MKRWNKQWRLRPYLFFILVLFNACFLILITAAIYVSVRHFFTDQISETRMEMLMNRHQQLSEKVAEIEETALSISTDRILRQALSPAPLSTFESVQIRRDLNIWLDNFVYIKPYISSVQVYTDRFAHEVKVGDNRRILPLESIPWKDELPRFSEMDAVWVPKSIDTYSEYEETPVLTYVLKMAGRGHQKAYVAVNLNEHWVARFLLNEGAGTKKSGSEEDGGHRQVVAMNPDGRVMTVVSDDEHDPVTEEGLLKHAVELDDDQSGFREITNEDRDYFMIYTGNERASWRLVEFIETEHVYKDINTIRNMMIVIGVIVLALTFPIASYLSSRIIRPIPSLLRGFQKIESGNFDTRLEENSIVEFNRLAKSFNHMGEQLHTLLHQLDQEHRQKRDLELKVLQSQINPHFLYNTLDMINWMAAAKGNPEVSQMAARLARLFRISVSKGSTFITLQEELEHARAYAQIQQARFEDQFRYTERVDPELMAYYVPKIIIQPFIENAIVHGFDPERTTAAEVTVSSERVDEHTYRLIIEDNGKGMKQHSDQEEKKRNSLYVSGTSGYGIRNVNDRIRTYLGLPYHARLYDRENGGVRVVITLPVIESPERINTLDGQTSSKNQPWDEE